MITRLTLVVLHCADLELSRRFYEALGLSFLREQHGSGPVHYAAELSGTVLDLYPSTASPGRIRLGFAILGGLDVAQLTAAASSVGGRVVRDVGQAGRSLMEDPDQNQVELVQSGRAFQLGCAANVLVPAITLLEQDGWKVDHNPDDRGASWRGRRGDIDLLADGPLELLALAILADRRGPEWMATDAQIDDVLKRMTLAGPDPSA